MTEGISFNAALSMGLRAKQQRVIRLLTRKELAIIAGVSEEDVELFEREQYLDPITQHKLTRTIQLIERTSNDKPKVLSKLPF